MQDRQDVYRKFIFHHRATVVAMVTFQGLSKTDLSTEGEDSDSAVGEKPRSRIKLPPLGEYKYGRVKPSLLGFRTASGFTGGIVGHKMSEALTKVVESDPRFMETVVVFTQKLIACKCRGRRGVGELT